MCAGDTPEDCGAKHVVFGVHFVPPSGARSDFVVRACVCVCVHRGMGAMFERILFPTGDPLRSVLPRGRPPSSTTPPTTFPKSPATTSDTLSSSASALHITSRRYELRELALLLGMCGQLVHQTFINSDGLLFFFFHFRSFLEPCGKTKEMLLVTSFLA